MRDMLKKIGPGLLFASSSIGTSHLVLSTRAGAHHGFIFIWIILACLLLKYPFFEFAPRYVSATGHSLLKGYRDQGKWAVIMFMLIIVISMFAVVGAVGAVSAGILSVIVGAEISINVLLAIVLGITAILLYTGGYKGLDLFIKVLSVVLLVSTTIAFIAVISKGPSIPASDFVAPALMSGTGLALLISLLGWMPSGLEASAMHSFWVLEDEKVTGTKATLKESLFDFNLGYGMTVLLALMFALIGAYTMYGTGDLLEGSSTAVASKLFNIFSTHIGAWAFPFIAIAAFGAIYGTLITAWDAFSRSVVRSLRVLRFDSIEDNEEQNAFLQKYHLMLLVIIGIGAYLLFVFSSSNMILMLEGATIFSFIAAPVIAFLNLRAIQSDDIAESHRPPKWMIILSWIGLIAMIAFAGYYVMDIVLHGHGGGH